jgi:hypothetical protein
LLSTAAGHRQQQEGDQGSLFLDRKIDEITAGLPPEYAGLLYNISIENAKTITDYILSMKIEVNLSDHYRQDVIKVLCKILRYHNNNPDKDKKSFKDKFVYHPNLPGPGSLATAHIQLEFHRSPGNVTPYHLAEYLQDTIIPLIEEKLKIVSDNEYVKISEFLERLKSLNSYLRLWRGHDMTYDIYGKCFTQQKFDNSKNWLTYI